MERAHRLLTHRSAGPWAGGGPEGRPARAGPAGRGAAEPGLLPLDREVLLGEGNSPSPVLQWANVSLQTLI